MPAAEPAGPPVVEEPKETSPPPLTEDELTALLSPMEPVDEELETGSPEPESVEFGADGNFSDRPPTEVGSHEEGAEVLGEGFWRYDLASGTAYFSPRFKRTLGYLPEELEDRFTTWLDLTDIAGQKKIRSVFLENPRSFAIQLELQKRDGLFATCVVRGWIEQTVLQGTMVRVEPGEVETDDRTMLSEAIEGGVEAMLVLRAVRDQSGAPVDLEIVELNAKGAALLGIGKEEALGRLLSEVAPATQENGAFDRYIAALESGEAQSQEFHASPGGFQQIWLSQRVVPVHNGVAVFTSDVSASRRAGEANDRSRRMFERITVSTPDLHAIWDLQTRRFVYANRTLFEILGYEEQKGSMVQLSAMERLLHPADLNAFRRHLQTLSEERSDRFIESELRFRAGDGTFRWMLFRDSVFDRHPDGRPRTILCTAQDVSRQKVSETVLQSKNEELERAREQLHVRQRQLEEANLRLGDLAMTDAVTGLKNRRAYQERLEEEVERAQRYKHRLALLLADVDRFKVYNDTYGHPEGDRALRGFGKVLTDVSRRSDTVARMGGEEFCIILPNTGADEAACLAERIRASLKGTEFGMRGMTASFGCSEVGEGKGAAERLVADADRALYQSKNEGRDRITVIK